MFVIVLIVELIFNFGVYDISDWLLLVYIGLVVMGFGFGFMVVVGFKLLLDKIVFISIFMLIVGYVSFVILFKEMLLFMVMVGVILMIVVLIVNGFF